jgi:hypothetical protein
MLKRAARLFSAWRVAPERIHQAVGLLAALADPQQVERSETKPLLQSSMAW